MNRKSGKIIKSDKVKVQGRTKLFFERQSSGEDIPTGGHERNAKVVSTDGESALIEVSCGCGSRFYIRCNYSELTQTA